MAAALADTRAGPWQLPQGQRTPAPHTYTHTHTQRAICCEDGVFDIKISAISASVKNHSSHISPEHEAIVVRDPESFYHIIAIRSCKIRISTFHCAFLKSENRRASWLETVLRPGAQERSMKSRGRTSGQSQLWALNFFEPQFSHEENETTA